MHSVSLQICVGCLLGAETSTGYWGLSRTQVGLDHLPGDADNEEEKQINNVKW